MRTFVTLAVLLILASAPLGHAHSPPEEPPKGVSVITGGELPTYHVWRTVLHALGSGDPDAPRVERAIPVSDAHREIILTYARKNAAAEQANRERQQKALDAMLAAGVKQNSRALREALAQIDYEHRIETMRTRDDLLAALPEEARYAFESWVENWRQNIRYFVTPRDLDLFLRQP